MGELGIKYVARPDFLISDASQFVFTLIDISADATWISEIDVDVFLKFDDNAQIIDWEVTTDVGCCCKYSRNAEVTIAGERTIAASLHVVRVELVSKLLSVIVG
ncbi:MAG TPA: hypothetical protein V6C65_27980 [Allocoleopsis sp.]